MSDQELAKKKEIFDARKGTTHWPVSIEACCRYTKADSVPPQNMNLVPAERPNYHHAPPRRPDDSIDPADRTRPVTEPEENPKVLRLVGVRA